MAHESTRDDLGAVAGYTGLAILWWARCRGLGGRLTRVTKEEEVAFCVG
jgi:hypothetical protein